MNRRGVLVGLAVGVMTVASSVFAGAQTGYEAAVADACARHGCDPVQLNRVIACESGGDHSAIGPNGERGILQIHPNGLYSDYYWSDPYTQIEVAAEAFGNGMGGIGSGGWVCQ